MIPKSLEKLFVFEENIWKFEKMIKVSKIGKKLKKISFLAQNLIFWSFLDPLSHSEIFLLFFFLNYILLWKFWYQDFENRVKTHITVIFNIFFINGSLNFDPKFGVLGLFEPQNLLWNWKYIFGWKLLAFMKKFVPIS